MQVLFRFLQNAAVLPPAFFDAKGDLYYFEKNSFYLLHFCQRYVIILVVNRYKEK